MKSLFEQPLIEIIEMNDFDVIVTSFICEEDQGCDVQTPW